MPKVVDAARVSVKHDAVWRTCTGCEQLAPLPPEVDRCDTCQPAAGSAIVPDEQVRGRSR
jgi:hypothetical protein